MTVIAYRYLRAIITNFAHRTLVEPLDTVILGIKDSLMKCTPWSESSKSGRPPIDVVLKSLEHRKLALYAGGAMDRHPGYEGLPDEADSMVRVIQE